MKKSIHILILTAMLTACVPTQNTQESAEISTAQTVTETSEYEEISESESYSEADTQPSTECEILTTETTVTAAETRSETVCTTTEENTENTTEKSDIPVQTEPPQTTESTEVTEEYEEETEPTEYGMSDYEKALEVYNYMTANGSGTCVQYSWQTYEMCCQYGLECYFAWTENRLYGHVANVVRIDGVWYVLDTQAGCFLTENMCGFTEIVDANESYIANADIISSVRYE